ncbi:MAG: ABC transporter permease [Lewinellaceae bacterium]|nr:ABC transporter permease [Lewinellaceae bacterium]
MFQNYLKIAWRNLLRHKSTGLINIGGLTIGMGVAIMIGLWMHDELTFDRYHENYDRLAQVYIHQTFNDKTGTGQAVSLPVEPTLRNEFSSDFDGMALTSWTFDHTLQAGEKILLKSGAYAQPDFPSLFSLKMRSGNYADALSKPQSIILSQSLAKALFGEEDPMGKTIRFDASENLKVTGVFEDLPKNTSQHEIGFLVDWVEYETQQGWVKQSKDNWGNHSFQLYVQLAEGADVESVSRKIKDIEKPHRAEGDPAYFLFPMSRWHLYAEFQDGVNTGGRIQYVRLFGLIGVFVLLLACINFMNLSTARSEKRAKEVGIRKTIGSVRGQLVGQFLSESLLVAFLSLVLAVALVQLSLGWFNELADKDMEIPWASPVFWALLVGFALITGILAGSYPAFYLSSFQPLKVLKGTFRAGQAGALPRQVLVTLQFTVSVALIIGTIVVFKQIEHAKNRPVGYDRSSLIQVRANTELEGKNDLLRENLLKTGVVEETAVSSGPITNIWSNQIGFDWEGKAPEFEPTFGTTACSYEFGKTVGWNIVEGRDFSREHGTDSTALVLNEAAVQLTGLTDIVGKTIRWDSVAFTVIGVVQNMVMESPWKPIKPTIFFLDPTWVNMYTVRLKPALPVQEALAGVKAVFEKMAPNTPFEYKFVDEEYDLKFQAEERIGQLARVFAFLAIFISCLGLFGLSAYVAEQRTKEIGVRKVLGATVADLWAMQSKGFVGLVILSCLIAAPIAWYYLDGWLADYDYRIELGWGVFAVAAVLALVVTLLTVSFQSIKAALANPVKSLRSE